jgi:phage regulator Rha-like protein
MKHLSPIEERDRKIAVAERRRHLKLIRLIKDEKREQKEIQKLMVVDINKPLS